MILLCHNVFAGRRNAVTTNGNRITIGRGSHNHLVLDNPLIAEDAAVLERFENRWRLSVHCSNGCTIGGRKIAKGESAIVSLGEKIELVPFQIQIEDDAAIVDSDWNSIRNKAALLVHKIHRELLDLLKARKSDGNIKPSVEQLIQIEHEIEQLAMASIGSDEGRRRVVAALASDCVREFLVEMVLGSDSPAFLFDPASDWRRMVTSVSHCEQAIQDLVADAHEQLGLDDLEDTSDQMQIIQGQFHSLWDDWQVDLLHDRLLYMALRTIKKQVKDLVYGYGPLEDLLRTPTISEVMVVDSNHIFIEQRGVVENSGRRFISDDVTLTVIDRIVSRVGRRIDKSQPLVDARLPDGSRVNAVIPPLAVSGPCITIRKFPHHRLRMEDLVAAGAMSPSVSEFLRACVIAKCNILIAGGTGTGKTTLLNCLSDSIPSKERIVTIEDTAELQIPREHVVRMEAKPANAEGNGAYTIRDLVKNSLRMRPDRIIIGECRGGEAIDMLQAMNTGHEGSLTTIHANNPNDVQLRLEVMVQSAMNLPIESIHRQIVSAIDIIVQLHRFRDGSRRVTQVVEVGGMGAPAGAGVRMKQLFTSDPEDSESVLTPTGYLPSFIDRLIAAGYKLEHFYC